MKKKILFFFASVVMVSCSNNLDLEETVSVQVPVVETLDPSLVPQNETIEKMFGKYSSVTRSMGIVDSNEEYDFQKLIILKILSKTRRALARM